MQGKEVRREDSRTGGLKRQESRNGGLQRQDSRTGSLQRQDSRSGGLQRQDSKRGLRRQESSGGLQRQDSRSGMKTVSEREPYQGGNTWKDSLRGASPSKPVWERSTASSRAKQSNGEGYVPTRRPSRSNSVSRRWVDVVLITGAELPNIGIMTAQPHQAITPRE